MEKSYAIEEALESVNSNTGTDPGTISPGPAGIIEILCTMLMMEHSTIIKSLGYNEPGTSCRINVQKETIESPISFALKTASGFGGGNASLILKSIE